jgi:DNA-directed RNA polymerase specialized sigma24 family protein
MVNDISATLDKYEKSLEIIVDIAESLSSAYESNTLSKDDLYQEIFLFCVDALPNYDNRGPLENFLRHHAKNRILNLLRFNKRRKAIFETVDIDALKENLYYEPSSQLETEELFTILEEELNIQERKILMKILDGIPVVGSRKNHVREKVREIIERRTGEDKGVGKGDVSYGDSQ